MRLAVSLLVLLAIAAIIGTVLNQQQPYSDYAFQFGSFWFRVFRDLGLYNVYRTGWFLAIVGFLVLSTATCLARNTPRMVREMREFPVRLPEASLRAMGQHRELRTALGLEAATAGAAAVLRAGGFRPRVEHGADGVVALAGVKGRYQRLGYLLTHVAIIVFCAGALYNADLPAKWRLWTGAIRPATDFALPLSQVPHRAWLPLDNPAFRGNVTLPEGETTPAVFEYSGDGYLVQPLPFRIRLKRFHIAFYSTGMPKDFVSEVELIGAGGRVLKEGAVRVNHPLSYDGMEIYQSSFGDGGSLLKMRQYRLDASSAQPVALEGRVGHSLATGDGYRLTLKHFRLYNVVPAAVAGVKASPGHPTVDLGPSFTYVVRSASGEGAEFKTYQQPLVRGGQSYFLQGVRTSFAAPYQYLLVPTGPHGGIRLFMDYLAALHQQAAQGVATTQQMLLDTFQQVVMQDAPTLGVDRQARFFQASLNTLLQLRAYPVPFLLTLSGFDHRWAAGLEVTKWPGTTVIYWGSTALVLGIFILFYLPSRRVWVRLRPTPDGTAVLAGGQANRNPMDFSKEFEALGERLRDALKAVAPEQGGQ